MTVTPEKIPALFPLLRTFSELPSVQAFVWGHETRYTGRMPENSHIHLLSFQLIKLYNRQIKGSQLPLPASHSCVCAQPFLAVFSGNQSSFRDYPPVKVRNSVSGGIAFKLGLVQLLWQTSQVAYQMPTFSSFLSSRAQFFLAGHIVAWQKRKFPGLPCS